MKKVIQQIPNLITALNLLSGCVAIHFLLSFRNLEDLETACYFIFLSAILDFLDGATARMLRVHSELGKQLDSMADMVSFGVVPGIMMWLLLKISSETYTIDGTIWQTIIMCSGFLITVFSGIRLAKFNLDTRQTSSFIGLPTPANSLLVVSLLMIFIKNNPAINDILLNLYFLLGLTLLLSYLLIAEIPLFALKFKNLKWKDNRLRITFILISMILLVIFQIIAIPFIVFLYVILSLSNNLYKKKQNEVQSGN